MLEGKILVLGGTGPAGICLLRELVHRKHSCFVFARSPSKIPEDLRTSPLLEVRLIPWLLHFSSDRSSSYRSFKASLAKLINFPLRWPTAVQSYLSSAPVFTFETSTRQSTLISTRLFFH